MAARGRYLELAEFAGSEGMGMDEEDVEGCAGV
jgi:hypothetical protein